MESESDESDESNSFAFCRTSSFVCSAAVLGGLPRPRFCFFAAGVGADAASASRAFFLSASLAYQTEIIEKNDGDLLPLLALVVAHDVFGLW